MKINYVILKGYLHAKRTGISYFVLQLNLGEAKNSSKLRELKIVDSKCRKGKSKENCFEFKIKRNSR